MFHNFWEFMRKEVEYARLPGSQIAGYMHIGLYAG